METAGIIQETLSTTASIKVHTPEPTLALRERWYGDMDMTTDDNYPLCWQDDAAAPDHGEHSKHKVEGPQSVCDRVTRFIVEQIEPKIEGKVVILVCHGDVCQIMATAFMNIEPWRHREIKHVDTANWRDTWEL